MGCSLFSEFMNLVKNVTHYYGFILSKTWHRGLKVDKTRED